MNFGTSKVFKETQLSSNRPGVKYIAENIIVRDLEICEVVESKIMEGDNGWTLGDQKSKHKEIVMHFVAFFFNLWIPSPSDKDGTVRGGEDLLGGRTRGRLRRICEKDL